MCQNCIRSMPEAPSTLCITWTLLVLVCVFDRACIPAPLWASRSSKPINSISGRATLTCVKVASDRFPRFHPPCVSRGTLCVCVCVCLILPASPTPHYVLPMFRDHLYLICGRATLSCVKIPFDPCPRLHPPCVSRWTLCQHCVCVGPCLVPPPPTVSNRW